MVPSLTIWEFLGKKIASLGQGWNLEPHIAHLLLVLLSQYLKSLKVCIFICDFWVEVNKNNLLPVVGIKECLSAYWKALFQSTVGFLMPCLFSFALSLMSWFSFVQDAITPYKEILQMYWDKVTSFVNARCDGLEPWQLIGLTFSSTLASVWLHGFLCQPESKYLAWGIFWPLQGGEVAPSCSWAVEGKGGTRPNTC